MRDPREQRKQQMEYYAKCKVNSGPCVDSDDYKAGYRQGLIDMRSGAKLGTRPTWLHVDSGQFLRWMYGYQDAVLYVGGNIKDLYKKLRGPRIRKTK